MEKSTEQLLIDALAEIKTLTKKVAELEARQPVENHTHNHYHTHNHPAVSYPTYVPRPWQPWWTGGGATYANVSATRNLTNNTATPDFNSIDYEGDAEAQVESTFKGYTTS